MKKIVRAAALSTSLIMAALYTAPTAQADSPANKHDSGPIVTGWTSGGDETQGENVPTDMSAAVAAYACWGYFSDIVRINNTIQYGGWTQCSEVHQLELRIVLLRYIDSSRTWKLVDSVQNARWGQLVNAVNDPACVPTSKSHYYRMQTFPLMDGMQMVNYAAYSESQVIPCRVDL